MLKSNKWIFALIICFIIVKNSSGLPRNSSLRDHGDECSTDSECASINGLCSSQQKCVCKPLYEFSNGKCTAALGAHCEEPSDCNIENVSCSDQKCFCPENMHLARNKTSCIRTAIAIGDSCEQTEDCQKVEHSHCSSSKCECKNNYFEQNKQCVKGIGADCTNKSECMVIDSECTGNKCSCPKNMHSARNGTSCIKNATVPSDFCEKGDDCSAVMHTSCEGNKCECQDPYFASNKKCVAELGTPCDKPSDCNIENVFCSDKKCSCPENMHLAVNKTSCIRNAAAPLDFCEKNEDCSAIMHTSCRKNKCMCKDKYFAKYGKCVAELGAPCNEHTDCNIEYAICSDNKCYCPEIMHLAPDKTSCIRNAAAPGDFCELAQDCQNVMHSNCSTSNKCECVENYVEQGKQCVATIGIPCKQNNDCQLLNTLCHGSTCQCEKQYVALSNKQCEEISSYGNSCTDQKQCACKNYPNCFLNETYIDLVCSEKCECPNDYHYIPEKFSCVHTAKALNDQCDTDDNCKFLRYSICSNKKCTCAKNHFVQNEQCVKGIGADCSRNSDCRVINSLCTASKCSCPKNMHLALNETSCIKNAIVPFDFCEQNEDCRDIMHTNCLDNRCKCEIYYSPTNKKCVAELGAPCNKPTDCNIESVSCSDNKCFCPENMHLARNKSSCIKNARAPLDFCENNEDCQFVNHTNCVKEKCVCKFFYFPKNGKCVTKLEAILAGIWDVIKGY
ncbi:prion-like-(Q/N-rich) domain-bearing protein 25 [Microplitis mediator]|uniref:prion-like-(Q/N-rich) domain-bearing protein 25 n=1 Tax=Microplitis mediator TaxID=375433 RepID=UPI0025546341|nr:prion-like-(Q/N-rich) domain-bearing protein 25 [Microplitis mediator]